MYMVCAANQGNGPGVASLLKHGADPLLKDDKGRLALHYVRAIWSDRVDYRSIENCVAPAVQSVLSRTGICTDVC